MRAYTVATTAVTLKVPPKWLDNVLSQNDIDGVIRKRQGIPRRLTPQAVITLDLALRLAKVFHTPITVALTLARRLREKAHQEAGIDAGKGFQISIDMERLEADVMARLADAVEISPSPRRGRPRRKG
jgi:plasmid maintenance system antidote protein VapI